MSQPVRLADRPPYRSGDAVGVAAGRWPADARGSVISPLLEQSLYGRTKCRPKVVRPVGAGVHVRIMTVAVPIADAERKEIWMRRVEAGEGRYVGAGGGHGPRDSIQDISKG